MDEAVLGGKDRKAAQRRWMELAGSPGEHLETLLGWWWQTNGDRAYERTCVVAMWPAPQARVADRAVELIEAAPFQGKESMRLWHLVYRIVLAHGRLEVAERLGGLVPRYEARIRGRTMGDWMKEHIALLVELIGVDVARRAWEAGPAPDLDAIEAAEAARDGDGLLQGLLRRWRVTRDGLTGRLVAHLSGSGEVVPIDGRQHGAWMERAGALDPDDLPALLPLVGVRGRLSEAAERIASLARFAPDPRVAARMVELLIEPEARQDNVLTLQIIGTLFAHADGEALRRLGEVEGAELGVVRVGLAARLAGRGEVEEPARLEALAGRCGLGAAEGGVEEAPTVSGRLVRLRELLSRAPSEAVWRQICDHVDGWPDDEDLAMGVAYASGHMDAHWPDGLRRAPLAWVQRAARDGGRTPSGVLLHRSSYAQATSDRVWAGEGERHHPGLGMARQSLVLSWWDVGALLAGPFGALRDVQLHASDAEAFARCAAKLPATVRRLELTGSFNLLRSLVFSPGVLPGLVELDLQRLESSGVLAVGWVARAPWSLRTLRMRRHGTLGVEEVAALSAGASGASLEVFAPPIHHTLGAQVMARLMAAGAFPALHTLDLTPGFRVEPEEGFPFRDGDGLPALRHLTLERWRLGEAHIEGLRASGRPLETLILGELSAEGAAAFGRWLGSSPLRQSLRRLEVGGPAVVEVLEAIAGLEGLEHLALSGVPMSGADLAGLCAGALPSRLRTLRVTKAGLAEVEALGQVTWPSLAELDLSGNALGAAAGKALAQARLPALRRLNLSGNPLKSPGALALFEAPMMAGLETLSLASCGLGPPAAKALAAVPFAHLSGLVLDGNALKAPGVEALLEASWVEELRRSNLEGLYAHRPLRMAGCSVNYALRQRFESRLDRGVWFG